MSKGNGLFEKEFTLQDRERLSDDESTRYWLRTPRGTYILGFNEFGDAIKEDDPRLV